MNNKHVRLFIRVERIHCIRKRHPDRNALIPDKQPWCPSNHWQALHPRRRPRLCCGNRFAHTAATITNEELKCLSIRGGNLANTHAILDECCDKLEVLKVRLRKQTATRGRLITGAQTISAFPDAERVGLETGKSGYSANSIQRAWSKMFVSSLVRSCFPRVFVH